eukprot:1157270-Pelagomonas_calceolata.AAC.13
MPVPKRHQLRQLNQWGASSGKPQACMPEFLLIHVQVKHDFDEWGISVKHDYNEMNEGETVVLTLADKALLARKGLTVEENDDDNDELENVLKVSMFGRGLKEAGSQCFVGWGGVRPEVGAAGILVS